MTEGRNSVVVSVTDMIFIVRVLNMLVVSWDRIGSCEIEPEVRAKLHEEFLRSWKVVRLIAGSRKVVCSYFPVELGPDEMDFLERTLKDDPHWTFDNRRPPVEWLRNLLDRPNET